jgi:acyl carrier protein
MTADEIRAHVVRELLTIAPEADADAIARDVPLRDQLDIVSFDFLNFVVALHGALGVDIPESDYARLATLDHAVAYLSERLATPKDASHPGGLP